MQDYSQQNFTAARPSSPQSVLQSIGAGKGGGLHQDSIDPAAPDSQFQSDSPDLRETTLAAELGPQLRVISIDESSASQQQSEDILQSTIESAKQIQQLASRLKSAKDELIERQRVFQAETESWHQRINRREDELDTRDSHLQQQSTHVRLQQQHVMQLQTDIVKSHEASKAAVSAIVANGLAGGVDAEIIRELKVLQRELGGRFDYISRRWEHLHRLLEDQRIQIHASQSVDDRVTWAASTNEPV